MLRSLGRYVGVLLLVLCALLRPEALRGQVFQVDTLRYAVGLRGGLGPSSITIMPYQPRSGQLGFEGGLMFQLAVQKHLGMRLELNYGQTGYKTVEDRLRKGGEESWVNRVISARQSWVNLPILLVLEYAFGPVVIRADGGGYFDYLLSERVGVAGGVRRQALSLSTHGRFGVGLCGGGSIGVNTPVGEFFIEYRSGYRQTDLYNRGRIPKVSEPRSNVHNQIIGVGYLYKFSKEQRKPIP